MGSGEPAGMGGAVVEVGVGVGGELVVGGDEGEGCFDGGVFDVCAGVVGQEQLAVEEDDVADVALGEAGA